MLNRSQALETIKQGISLFVRVTVLGSWGVILAAGSGQGGQASAVDHCPSRPWKPELSNLAQIIASEGGDLPCQAAWLWPRANVMSAMGSPQYSISAGGYYSLCAPDEACLHSGNLFSLSRHHLPPPGRTA